MQQTLRLGQVVQPSVLSRVERTVKYWRASFDKKVRESEFCQVLDITPELFTLRGLAFTACVGVVIILLFGLFEWLEGGAL